MYISQHFMIYGSHHKVKTMKHIYCMTHYLRTGMSHDIYIIWIAILGSQ